MSDLLNKASLVMVPSGYKEDTVYSVIPTDGSGDLSFTRASNGTRVNSAGLVEVCPWNLCTYSEQFQNADWSGGGLGKPTMTDNFAEAPNGTMTASKMEAVSDQYQIRQNNAQENTQMNLSVWLRTNTGTKTIQLFLNNGNTASQNITVTTTWTRYEISGLVTTLSGSGRNGLVTLEALTSSNYILVWGFQLSVGLTAKPYFPTTDRLNVPRLTYQNGGGGCPSLLLEKQSTNQLLYSEDFTNGAWTLDGNGVGQSVTANYSISPDGTQNADRLQLNKTGGTLSRIYQNASSGANSYVFSVYMKSNTSASQNVGLRLDTIGINCVVTTSWQRFTLNATVGTPQAQIILFDSITGNDETADISVWGAQLEASSYATSYIPTTSSSATRVADACSKTGISSLIGQTEGVVFVDFVIKNNLSSVNRVISLTGNNWLSNGSIRLDVQSHQATLDIVYSSGTSAQIIYSATFSPNIRYKVAMAYKENDCKMYINGTDAGSDTSTNPMPACSQLYLNELGGGFGGPWQPTEFNEVVLFKTRLTNAELASLTTI